MDSVVNTSFVTEESASYTYWFTKPST
jgi:hypothetical protein